MAIGLSQRMDLGQLAKTLGQRSQTTPETVAAVLREAIAKGILRAGQPLRGEEIAQQMGVSRIPVREALRQLEVEGLVHYYPNRGAFVADLDTEQIREIYEIRMMLEVGALRRAVPRLGPAQLHKAWQLLEATEAAEDGGEWGRLEVEFHETLYALEDRPRLARMIDNLLNIVDRYWHMHGLTLKHRAVFERAHRAIWQACRGGDVERAVGLLEEHLERSANLLIGELESRAVK